MLSATPSILSDWFVLVDFDNFYYDKRDNALLTGITEDIRRITELIHTKVENSASISVRFYGGWLKNGVYTQSASLLQQVISSIQAFPIITSHPRKILRGELTLANSLIAMPKLVWPDTNKVRQGLKHERIYKEAMSETCIGEDFTCPVKILARFTRHKGKKCPITECPITNEQAFFVSEQKMVDTMIACDIIDLASFPNTMGIFLLTNDTDLLPAICRAAQRTNLCVSLVKLEQPRASPFDNELEKAGVQLLKWEDVHGPKGH